MKPKRSVWESLRLAIADAILIVTAVCLLLFGSVALAFGLPELPTAGNAEVLLAAIESFLLIVAVVAAVMFFFYISDDNKNGREE